MKRIVKIGNRYLGGEHPVLIQSMTNTKTSDVAATVAQILALEAAGCDIVRVTVNDEAAAEAIRAIKAEIHIPLVADIHFDYRLALKAIENGVDKVRLNPGNIGSEENIRQVVEAAKRKNIPIRIGVNSGSIEKHILEKYEKPCAQALVESALYHIALLEKFDFYDIVVSLKASDVAMMHQAYKMIAQKTSYPLHLGVTEAGGSLQGVVKSSIGIGSLLLEGIGNTLRVSLTENPVEEIPVAKEILMVLGLKKGVEIVSCPTCGRTEVDLIGLAKEVEKRFKHLDKSLKIAVMGCVVNGPGEAKEADFGVAAGRGVGIIFKKGEIVKQVKESEILDALEEIFHEF